MKPFELFNQTGYALKQGVFSADEIVRMRNEVTTQFLIDQSAGITNHVAKTNARYAKGDLLSKKMLRHILLDKRIVQMAKDILNSNDIAYFGDSTYQIGRGARGFHRDCVDREFASGPDWEGQYNLIRMGIYLQDHIQFSGGLKIKVGSHLNKSGKTIFLDTKPGDVAAWSLKTLHSGNAVRLKGLKNVSIDNSSLENRIPRFMKLDEEQERAALFMTFGVPGAHMDRYINEYMLKRPDVIENMKVSVYDDEALALVKESGVKLIQPLLQTV
jgi:Phytanoyl-CoA dioxygenase (PhyH)